MHVLQGLSDHILVSRHQDLTAPTSRASVHVHLHMLHAFSLILSMHMAICISRSQDLHLGALETNTIAGQSSSAQIDGTLRRLC